MIAAQLCLCGVFLDEGAIITTILFMTRTTSLAGYQLAGSIDFSDSNKRDRHDAFLFANSLHLQSEPNSHKISKRIYFYSDATEYLDLSPGKHKTCVGA